MTTFDKAKKELLLSLRQGIDYSPKGSIDLPVRDLVEFINHCPNYVTTSSCSGRISLFEPGQFSKGINWLLVKHQIITKKDVLDVVSRNDQSSRMTKLLVMLKCEPFILHVHCRHIDSARLLHHIAYSSGYRESGLSIGTKKIMVAIRTTAFGLEMPIGQGSRLLVDDDLLDLAIKECNQRLLRNFSRVDKLLLALKAEFHYPTFRLLPKQPSLVRRYGHCAWCMPCSDNISEGFAVVGGLGSPIRLHEGSQYETEMQLQAASRKQDAFQIRVQGQTGLFIVPETKLLPVANPGELSAVHAVAHVWNVSLTLPRGSEVETLSSSVSDRMSFLIMSGGRNSPDQPLPCLRISVHPSSSSVTSPIPIIVEEFGDLAPCSRWGHSFTRLSAPDASCGVFFLVGGRDNDNVYGDAYLLILQSPRNLPNGSIVISAIWKRTQLSADFSPRTFHAACGLSSCFSTPLAFPAITSSGRNPSVVEQAINLLLCEPSPLLFDAVLVHGGLLDLNSPITAGELYVIYPLSGNLVQLGAPGGAFTHSLVSEDDIVLSERIEGEKQVLDESEKIEKVGEVLNIARFGHTITSLGGKCYAIVGGSSFSTVSEPSFKAPNDANIVILEIQLNDNGLFTGMTQYPSIEFRDDQKVFPCGQCRVHHQTIFQSDLGLLHIIGGGAPCLSFGTHYCESVSLHCGVGSSSKLPGMLESGSSYATIVSASEPKHALECQHQDVAVAGLQSTPEVVSTVFLIRPQNVKQVKTILERFNLLDKSKRISRVDNAIDNLIRCVIESDCTALKNEINIRAEDMDDFNVRMCIPLVASFAVMFSRPSTGAQAVDVEYKEALKEIISTTDSNIFCVGRQITRENKLLVVSGFRKAIDYLTEVANQRMFTEAAIRSIPSKFELVGDVLMIPEGSLDKHGWEVFSDDAGSTLATEIAGTSSRQISPTEGSFWGKLASCFGATRVARKALIDSGEMRESKVRLLYPISGRAAETGPGSIGWVTVIENGIRFSFDITRVMFCSGNVTERMRMGRQPAAGQVIVDLYCGVGYYTLPFLVHGNAAHVHACEWNPNSILALRHNLATAGVTDRCTVYEGDNNISSLNLHNIADRISCGLLPSSVKGWPLAVRCLKATGGMIHVHENVLQAELAEWTAQTCDKFIELFSKIGKPMSVVCTRTEIVKSYAPRVVHIVLDLLCEAVHSL